MKIHKLTMNAFLTYKDKTIIHFDELIHHGIYLITGTTGSGKTTIFDAITFALYGTASGSQRNPTYFRSDYASHEDETYVELEFELHNKMYKIKRSPTYIRIGYKTPKMANATLSYDDVIIEGVKEVNQKVNQLLGVDVHQFKQIVMIAQGEFTKLIYASSEEREKVLRHIFHSEPLVQFENILKDKAKQYKDDYSISSQKLLSQFQLLQLPLEFLNQHKTGFHPSFIEDAIQENEKIVHVYQEHQNHYQDLSTKYDQLSKEFYQHQQNNINIQHYQTLTEDYQELLIQEPFYQELDNKIHKLKHIQNHQVSIQQFQALQKEVTNLKKQSDLYATQKKDNEQLIESLQKEYNHLPIYRKEKEEMLIKLQNMEQTLQQQKAYQKLCYQYEKHIQEQKRLKTLYSESMLHHQKLKDRIERDQEKVNKLPKLQLELQKNEQMTKEMNKKRVTIHELSQLYDEFKDNQDIHYELSQKYKKADEKYRQLLQRYQHEDENYKRQQAGILALQLEDHQPCPVCGSTTHPHPASLISHVFNPHELEELNRKVEKSQEVKDTMYQDVLLQNQKLSQIQSQIDLLKKQLDIQEDLSKQVFITLLHDIMEVISKQEETYQRRKDEIEYLEKLQNSIFYDQQLLQQQSDDLEQFQQDIYQLEATMAGEKTQKENMEKSGYIQSQELQQAYQKQLELYKKLERQIDDIDIKYHQSKQDIVVIDTKYQDTIRQLSQKDKELTTIHQEMNEWIEQTFTSLQEYQDLLQEYIHLQDYEKKVQDFQVQKRTLNSNIQTYKEKIKNISWVDLSLMQQQLNELELQRNEALELSNHFYHKTQQNQKIIKELQKDYKSHQDIFENYTLYQDLSDITSGKNGQRISFERYVLSSYFEHILEYANIELLKMSQGRFELYRKKETKGAKQQGLDLSVLDYETGMMRDIQSLSGGESFKAALSLALGLSSMIQNYAGAIELNTLFIDEGFGSLDNESLDQALSVLLDLKNDNKVIGIISHVNELKERISSKIIVEKTKQGSCVEIVKE